jgi:hypothetical protein
MVTLLLAVAVLVLSEEMLELVVMEVTVAQEMLPQSQVLP